MLNGLLVVVVSSRVSMRRSEWDLLQNECGVVRVAVCVGGGRS